ncbi:MAG: hypothetical protein JOY71_17270 [Acetobacteraceae bacterium]|nr:hypothetical protein [Acetobacteraceae bacterium]MBV8589951.1 hypothetical protein [Acetobacteraceae bacterium]
MSVVFGDQLLDGGDAAVNGLSRAREEGERQLRATMAGVTPHAARIRPRPASGAAVLSTAARGATRATNLPGAPGNAWAGLRPR